MNPQKKEKKIELQFHHRLIIVVFIPSLEGYYKNVFDVFKLCLQSASTTSDSNCAITIVNNASCIEVQNYLNKQFENKTINCLINHNENIGKMDALIGAAKSSREPLITLSDVDILFKQGWQSEVEKIFINFENVGSVSPIPCRKIMNYGTTSTLQKIILKKLKLTFEKINENFDDHNKYLKSINWEQEEDSELKWPVIQYKNIKAILGSGHQIMTINRKIFFKYVPVEPSLTLVGNQSEFIYCDQPIDFSGGLRLATYNNFAYHMGNTVETWMLEVQNKNLKETKQTFLAPKDYKRIKFINRKRIKLFFFMKQRMIVKLFRLFYLNNIK